MKISVIVPVYNEIKFIEEVIKKIKDTGMASEIIVVDDLSTDGTREILDRLRSKYAINIIYQAEHKGKGAAIRAGFKIATGDTIITQDADLEYDPKEYSQLIQPVKDGLADVVYGSRMMGG